MSKRLQECLFKCGFVTAFEIDQMEDFISCIMWQGTHHDFAVSSRNIIAAGNAFEGNTYEDTVVKLTEKQVKF